MRSDYRLWKLLDLDSIQHEAEGAGGSLIFVPGSSPLPSYPLFPVVIQFPTHRACSGLCNFCRCGRQYNASF